VATTTIARRRRAPKTIDEYIDRCAPQAKPILRRVRATIAKAAPEATETISYGMPAFNAETRSGARAGSPRGLVNRRRTDAGKET